MFNWRNVVFGMMTHSFEREYDFYDVQGFYEFVLYFLYFI